MIQSSFTLEQLFCMAQIARKKRLFGIADPFQGHDTDNRSAVMSETVDELLQLGVVEVDFINGVCIKEQYKDYLSFICDCDMCLVCNQMECGDTKNVVLWKKNGTFLMAEMVGNRVVLSNLSMTQVEYLLAAIKFGESANIIVDSFCIPQIELSKAKRLLMNGKRQEAVRVLRQNGTEQHLVRALLTGLEEKASFLGLTLVDCETDGVNQTEHTWLFSEDILLSLQKQVINYRTCTRFEVVSFSLVNEQICSVRNRFCESRDK